MKLELRLHEDDLMIIKKAAAQLNMQLDDYAKLTLYKNSLSVIASDLALLTANNSGVVNSIAKRDRNSRQK